MVQIQVCTKCKNNKNGFSGKKLFKKLKQKCQFFEKVHIEKSKCLGMCKSGPAVKIVPSREKINKIRKKEVSDIMKKALKHWLMRT